MPKSRKAHDPKNSEKSQGWGRTRYVQDDPGADLSKIDGRKGGVMRVPRVSISYCPNCGYRLNLNRNKVCCRCYHRAGDQPTQGWRKDGLVQ